MSAVQLKLNLHQMIDSVENEERLKTLENLISAELGKDLHPMTLTEFYARIDESEKAVREGSSLSQEDLEKDTENW